MLTAILRHPALQSLKRATRSVWWRYRVRAIANPPVPARVESVLFVCLGNICRSPFAELIAAHRVGSSPGGIRFMSAGIRTKQAAEPPEDAKQVAQVFGVSLDQHRPRSLTRELMAAHDIVVVMESGQMELLRTMYPELRGRVFLLSLFEEGVSGLERYAISDPFGLPRAAYEECYRRIDGAVTALLTSLGSRVAVSEQPVSRGLA
jgi:protein-tyrosine phosphatase